MKDVAGIIDDLVETPDAELRGRIFALDGTGPDPQHLYPHQLEGLRRVEAHQQKHPPVSGILHYPVGAGKKRVALQALARALAANPTHRFVWSAGRREPLRQAMLRLAELSALFPEGTTLALCQDADEVEAHDNAVQVSFMTRAVLTEVFERAADSRRKVHAWRRHLDTGAAMTLVYDACHELGEPKLQTAWQKFYYRVVKPDRGKPREWMTLGLDSAPLPAPAEAQKVMSECIFPRENTDPSRLPADSLHILHKVFNEALVDEGVLCRLNTTFDACGHFDLPRELLQILAAPLRLAPPGVAAPSAAVQAYCEEFNRVVMSDRRVLEFLAQRLGDRLGVLGKTLVFVPTREAADELAALLGPRHGTKPSVLVKPSGEHTGHDDPQIKTVVLASLTPCTDSFWRLIRKGAHGPALRGTTECHVIEPIKLSRLHAQFDAYQPSLQGTGGVEPVRVGEDGQEEAPGEGALPPQISATKRPPDPTSCPYAIAEDVAEPKQGVGLALENFLNGDPLSELQALDVCRTVRVDFSEGRPVLGRSSTGFETNTATALMLREIGSLEARSGKDLEWLRRRLPSVFDRPLLEQQLRAARAIEALSLWTEPVYSSAHTSGAFQKALSIEAHEPAPNSQAHKPSYYAFSAAEVATMEAALSLLGNDAPQASPTGQERFVILHMLRELFGTRPSDELDAVLRGAPSMASVPNVERLRQCLTDDQRQRFLREMTELAATTGSVSPEKRAQLARFASQLEIPRSLASAILDFDLDPKRASGAPVSGVTCRRCAFEAPDTAAFCPGCGTNLATERQRSAG